MGSIGALGYASGMDQDTQDLRDLLRMASLLKGAAGRALFQDCSVVFLGVAELLERRALLIAEEAPVPGEHMPDEAAPASPSRPHRPVNIVT